MTLASVKAKLNITGFSAAQKASIIADITTAYNGSAIAKGLFDSWTATKAINITYKAGVYQAYAGTGNVEIDPAYLAGLSYISTKGAAVQHSQLGALLHELGHALTGKLDNYNVAADYYMGDNVTYTNTIWKQLGLAEEVSYVAQARPPMHITGYEYTNGATINGAITSNAAVTVTKATNDLLIGGASANALQSGAGNDFLVGQGGDDDLNGGDGTDTTVFFGNAVDYDVRLAADGSWTVRHVRGTKTEGADVVKNVEKIQFAGGQTFDLKKEGLTFQTDFALVIDTTGSMGGSIGSVKAQAVNLINALFAGGAKDARIGIVGFKDTTNGEPSEVILSFTDQDDFAARQAAALAAINGITVGGGGDLPETDNDGLITALNGSMGAWRPGASTYKIVLFTDAEVKDTELAGAVATLAANLGVSVSGHSSAAGARGALDTFSFVPADGSSGLDTEGNPLPGFTRTDDPITGPSGIADLQVYTIFTGDSFWGVDTSGLSDIAARTGGSFLTAESDEDLVDAIFKIIALDDNKTVIGTKESETLKGGTGDDTIVGKAGNDKLVGFAGDDTLTGGKGNDKLIGGEDSDVFVFNVKLGKTNVDTIKDYVHDVDLIALDDKFFAGIGPVLNKKEFYAAEGATKAHDKSDRIVYDTKTGKLYFDDDGNKSGGHTPVHFATLSTKPMIDHGDFMIV